MDCSVVERLSRLAVLNLGCFPTRPLHLGGLGSLRQLSFTCLEYAQDTLFNAFVVRSSLSALTGLTSLDCGSDITDMPEELSLLTSLEVLHLGSATYPAAALSGLARLHTLVASLPNDVDAFADWHVMEEDRDAKLEAMAELPALRRVRFVQEACGREDFQDLQRRRQERGCDGELRWAALARPECGCPSLTWNLFDR